VLEGKALRSPGVQHQFRNVHSSLERSTPPPLPPASSCIGHSPFVLEVSSSSFETRMPPPYSTMESHLCDSACHP